MRPILLLALLLPLPSEAGQVRPAAYAAAWCQARAEGASVDAATAFAVHAAYDHSAPSLPQVGGSSLDVRAAVAAAYARCPRLFQALMHDA